MPQQKVTISLPDKFKSADKEEIAALIIEYIRDRTQQGTGIRSNGRLYDFPAYEDAYAKSKGSRKVDLTMSEELLTEMKMLSFSDRKNTVTIGYEAGSDVNGKAEGNIIGSYGRDPNPRKARSFLGVNKSELAAILAGLDE
jgi:hypothetical protein